MLDFIDDPLSPLQHNPHPGATFLGLLFLALCRLMPILSLSPFLGAKILPLPTRVALAVLFFFLLMPHLWMTLEVPLGFNLFFLSCCFKEFIVGFIFGFLVSFPFLIVQSAGVLVDFQRGSSSLTAQDPILSQQASPIGLLYNQVLIALFFLLGGFGSFLEILVVSYKIIPPTKFPSATFMADSNYFFWQQMFGLMGNFCRLFAQIAAPPVLATLLGDMFLGIANRLAPQVQISFLGMALKSLLGIAFILLGWNLLTKQMNIELIRWFQLTEQAIRSVF